MNTIQELLNSNKEEAKEHKDNALEKAVIKNIERKERKLDEDYQNLSQLENKVWLKVLTLACPFIGTLLGVGWSLFQLETDKQQLTLIIGLLVSTIIGNILGGILSLLITNSELQRTEIDMYNGMKTKHIKDNLEKEQAIKDKDKVEFEYKKLFEETTQLRKEHEEKLMREEVERRVKEKEKEIEARVQEELNKRKPLEE